MPSDAQQVELMDDFTRQVGEYTAVRPIYHVFSEVLQSTLSEATRSMGVEAIVQARTKEIASFAEKMIRKQEKYPDPVSQLTDLCGARVITSSTEQIGPICEFIRKHFIIDEANSEDVVHRLGASTFGYRSVHFTVSLKRGEFEERLGELAGAHGPEGSEARAAFEAGVEKLYESRTPDAAAAVPAGPMFKAEIQVRSLLQHAWATFAHDQLYKSDFEVPLQMERDGNRVAAMLEEADEAFARTSRAVRRYSTYYGAYLSPERREEEIERLTQVLSFDPANQRLAHQIARLAMSAQDWERAEAVLAPFVQKWEDSPEAEEANSAFETTENKKDRDEVERADATLERLRDPEVARVLSDYGRALCASPDDADAARYLAGRRYLLWGIALDRGNVDPYLMLAESYTEEQGAAGWEDEALSWYERAFAIDPTDPVALNGYLRFKVHEARHRTFVPMMRPSLEAAIERCRDRSRTGVYLPHAHYDIGLFALLLDRPYESLAAFAKALESSDSAHEVKVSLERMQTLRSRHREEWPELDCACRFLAAARVAKLWVVLKKAERDAEIDSRELATAKAKLAELEEKTDSARDPEAIEEAKRHLATAVEAEAHASARAATAAQRLREARGELLPLTSPEGPNQGELAPVIVAGGCDESVQQKIETYTALLASAFDGFEGSVVCGGTTAGISGLVGNLDDSSGGLRKLAYLPKMWAQHSTQHDAYEIVKTTGTGFTALEPIQGWIDLLAAGVDPGDVKVLGINGGDICAFEFRMALAFGAEVAVVRGSGRAAVDILSDEDWGDHKRLFALPNEGQTAKMFVQGVRPGLVLDDETRVDMARQAHESYRQKRGEPLAHQDPSLSDWSELPESLRESNLQQIDHIEDKLHRINMILEKADPEAIGVTEFEPEEVELLAEIEHARWNVERLRSGWRYAEDKDVELKHSPFLVPWSELSEEVKEWDRRAVRQIPAMMRERGYRIVRASGAADEAAEPT